MKLVSDTGPLIALAKVRQVELLDSLFTELWIPPAVAAEISAKPGPDTEVLLQILDTKSHVKAGAPPAASIATQLKRLDLGEREAVVLAHQMGCELLIDDRIGRTVARQLNVPVTGVAGLLITAKRRDLIPAVSPVLREMRKRGYWLSDALLEVAAKIAKE